MTEQKTCDLTVYYDGSCPLCTAEISHYRKIAADSAVDFVDVSAEAVPHPDLSRETAMARFHVRTASGELVSGARAFAALWAYLPGWRHAARIARLPGVTPLLELGYRAFLPVRPALSRIAARFGAKPERQAFVEPKDGC